MPLFSSLISSRFFILFRQMPLFCRSLWYFRRLFFFFRFSRHRRFEAARLFCIDGAAAASAADDACCRAARCCCRHALSAFRHAFFSAVAAATRGAISDIRAAAAADAYAMRNAFFSRYFLCRHFHADFSYHWYFRYWLIFRYWYSSPCHAIDDFH